MYEVKMNDREIIVNELKKTYPGNVTAVQGVSFKVEAGVPIIFYVMESCKFLWLGSNSGQMYHKVY